MSPARRRRWPASKTGGFLLLVVTNQPDVARGTQTLETIQAMHRILRRSSAARRVPGLPARRPGCLRLPQAAPGLLLEAQERHGIDLRRSFLVGDRWRDIDAGRAAGCRTVFLDFGYRERGPSAPPDARVASLAEAVDWIVEQEGESE